MRETSSCTTFPPLTISVHTTRIVVYFHSSTCFCLFCFCFVCLFVCFLFVLFCFVCFVCFCFVFVSLEIVLPIVKRNDPTTTTLSERNIYSHNWPCCSPHPQAPDPYTCSNSLYFLAISHRSSELKPINSCTS